MKDDFSRLVHRVKNPVKSSWQFLSRRRNHIPMRGQSRDLSWKPPTLKAPLLIGISTFSVATIILLESLSRRSSRDGGVSFADDFGYFAPWKSFLFNYLPTIIAVCYSMIWNWIELDVRRLEPYFQLSKPTGALAEQSVLLQYPTDYLALVPLKAAKQKHWSVFTASTAVLIIFWVITPFQSAIFAYNLRHKVTSVKIQAVSNLSPATADVSVLDTSFMNTAYGLLWLGEEFPGFVTRDYVLRQFDLGQEYKNVSTTWTVPTVSYSTDFTCIPVQLNSSESDIQEGVYKFTDEKGCTTKLEELSVEDGDYYLNYYGFSYIQNLPFAAPFPRCTSGSDFHGIAIWGEIRNGTSGNELANISASFCTAQYHIQPVNATIASENSSVIASIPTGSRKPLSYTDFNRTEFEYILNLGDITTSRDFPDRLVIDIIPRVDALNEGIQDSVAQLVGFALGASNSTIQQYSDPTSMQQAFDSAYKLLFALAVNELMISSQRPADGSLGLVNQNVQAIVVVRVVALVIEGFLAFVAACSVTLLLLNWQRKINITKDPASTKDVIDLLPTDLVTLQDFMDRDTGDAMALEEKIKGEQYKLRLFSDTWSSAGRSLITKVASQPGSLLSVGPGQQEKITPSKSKPILPLLMTWAFGLPFVIILLLSIVLLIALYKEIKTSNGLRFPTDSNTTQQILLNYIPTAFATFIEPVWAVLGRLLCILQPFKTLLYRNTRSLTSVGLRYVSLPPQFIVWRAIRARHYLLASVCMIALLANVLAIALSSLFNVQSVLLGQKQSYFLRSDPLFSGSYRDLGVTYVSQELYYARANLTKGTPLPPWTAPDMYFIPVNYTGLSDILDAPVFEVSTNGFGIDSRCQSSENLDPGNTFEFNLASNGSQLDFVATYALEGGEGDVTCVPNNPLSSTLAYDNDRAVFLQVPGSTGFHTLAFTRLLSPLGNLSKQAVDFCGSQMLFGWLQANFTENIDGSQTSYHASNPNVQLITCRPALKAAKFLVRATSSGQVLSYVQKEPFDSNIEQYFAATTNTTALFAAMAPYLSATSNSTALYLIRTPTVEAQENDSTLSWRNTTYATDWTNYFLKSITNSSTSIDSQFPLLSKAVISSALQTTHRLIFAVLLALYSTQLFPPSPLSTSQELQGKVYTSQLRIFMNPVFFVITVIILSLNLVVAIIYYIQRPARFLPRMPTSIASIFAYVAPSQARRNRSALSNKDERYRFGRYIGIDGKIHIGIEKAELVFPLAVSHKEKKWKFWQRPKAPPAVPPKN